jgi:hypothetical protein
MTNMKFLLVRMIAVLLGASVLVPAFAYALDVPVSATGVVNTSAQANTPAGSVNASAGASIDAKTAAAKAKADQEIDRRIASLNDLNTRIGNLARVTASFKQSLNTNVQNQITGLTQLKAKIDADTDADTLKTDLQSVNQSYRIYALVLPMTRLAAAADREVTIITMMNQLGAKLQARISAAQSSGANTSALMAALTDLSNKLADASTQSQAAVSVTASLTPDNGDKTKMEQNLQALKTGRSDVQAAQKDLVAARKDIDTIVKGLGKLPQGGASASSTTQVQTTP